MSRCYKSIFSFSQRYLENKGCDGKGSNDGASALEGRGSIGGGSGSGGGGLGGRSGGGWLGDGGGCDSGGGGGRDWGSWRGDRESLLGVGLDLEGSGVRVLETDGVPAGGELGVQVGHCELLGASLDGAQLLNDGLGLGVGSSQELDLEVHVGGSLSIDGPADGVAGAGLDPDRVSDGCSGEDLSILGKDGADDGSSDGEDGETHGRCVVVRWWGVGLRVVGRTEEEERRRKNGRDEAGVI